MLVWAPGVSSMANFPALAGHPICHGWPHCDPQDGGALSVTWNPKPLPMASSATLESGLLSKTSSHWWANQSLWQLSVFGVWNWNVGMV